MTMLMVAFTEMQRMSPAVITGSACLVIGLSLLLWQIVKKKLGRRFLGIMRLTALLLFIPFVCFLVQQLIVRIDDKGVYYRYFAGKYVEKTVAWYDVDQVSVTNVKSYQQEGGKASMSVKAHENEFTIKGDTAMCILLKDKTKLILGTQKADELKQKLNELVAAGVINSNQVVYK